MQIEKVVGEGSQAVYVFNFPSQYRAEGAYPCKIGHTTTGDVRKRLGQYQAGMQEAPTVSLVIMCDDSQSLEAHLHNTLADKRIAAYGAEWFMTTPDEVLAVYSNSLRATKSGANVRSVADVGMQIRMARRKAGLTQTELAKRNNVTTSWLSWVENGKESAEIGLVFRIVNDLGIAMTFDPGPHLSTSFRAAEVTHDDDEAQPPQVRMR